MTHHELIIAIHALMQLCCPNASFHDFVSASHDDNDEAADNTADHDLNVFEAVE